MDIFSVLAVPTRRNILETLANKGQLSATAICDQFWVSPPAISQHLKILRRSKLVVMEKRGQQRIYYINPKAFNELESWMRQMSQAWQKRFDVLDKIFTGERKKTEIK